MKKEKSKTFKGIVSIVICLGLVFTLTSNIANAAGYTAKRAKCPACGRYNYSFGYMENFGGTNQSVSTGQYCDGCNKIVPAGEHHSYSYTTDRYSFSCGNLSCQKLYYEYYDNPVSAHYINGVKQ